MNKLESLDHRHHLPMDGDGGVGGARGAEPQVSGVHCSICLDLVSDNGGRSRAKLQCGHEFHLGKRYCSCLCGLKKTLLLIEIVEIFRNLAAGFVLK
jgi:hypothetical protein